jgi:hypothetical protein
MSGCRRQRHARANAHEEGSDEKCDECIALEPRDQDDQTDNRTESEKKESVGRKSRENGEGHICVFVCRRDADAPKDGDLAARPATSFNGQKNTNNLREYDQREEGRSAFLLPGASATAISCFQRGTRAFTYQARSQCLTSA